MAYFIKIGKNTGCCKSCSLKGNKRRLGTTQSIDTRKRMSLASLGKRKSLQHRMNISEAKMGKKTGIVPRSAFKKGMKLTKEQIAKCLRRRPMSGLEIKIQKVIDKYKLPYKFVGNGEFFIERKNPDFINVNDEKKAIEVYYERQKNEFRNGGALGWMQERKNIFGKYGWKIIFIEGTGLNEEKILNLLGKGVD
jgi:hypothetical protein